MTAKRFSVIFFALCMAACATMSDRTVQITAVQVQKKMNDRLLAPILLLNIFELSLSNALVKFDGPADRMQTTLDVRLTSLVNKKLFTGKVTVSGKLRFDATALAIVLDEPKVERLDVDGAAGKYADFAHFMAQKLGSEMLNGLTLYSINPADLKIGSIQYQAKNMQMTDGALHMTFSPVK
ncbi:MAG: DUF1439 domain-containing protein [Methylotenera sp.]|nr:DUF1439 domain-containing protein [Methylotenera sp.]